MRVTHRGKGASSKSSRPKGFGPLMRPIIAICNDPYAPALRPLREIAKVFKVAPPSSARLNGRLREVCAKRGMRADTRALGYLAERAEGARERGLARAMPSEEGNAAYARVHRGEHERQLRGLVVHHT